MRPLPALILASAVALSAIAGCGGNQYGYARTYAPYGAEGQYYQTAVDLSYQDVLRFPYRYPEELVGWFGVVTNVEATEGEEGASRLTLDYRRHRERHLCGDERDSSCRVTVSERTVGPFIVDLVLRPEDRQEDRFRLRGGSLARIYGYPVEGGTDETGPILRGVYYRHWPAGTWRDTGAAGRLRR